MSLYNYFTKLKTITYNDDVVNNIITSIRFKEIINTNEVVFYPYVVEEGERPDQIAAHYYDDDRYSWLVYLSNQIIDPYFQWHLTSEQFNEFIKRKYGSIEQAQTKIAFYRINWYTDDSLLSSAAYQALPAALKRYWNPIISYSGSIGSYERKRIDTILETNKVISLTLNNTEDISIGEKVYQRTSGAISATGFVVSVSSSSIVVNNITGAFATTAGAVGTLTDANTTFSKNVTSVNNLASPITSTEASYWESVDWFTYENELNESRKTIRLLDKQYIGLVEDQMIEILS